MAEFAQTPESAERLLNDVLNGGGEDGPTRWPGMTYEQGVTATLRWLLDGLESPMEE